MKTLMIMGRRDPEMTLIERLAWDIPGLVASKLVPLYAVMADGSELLPSAMYSPEKQAAISVTEFESVLTIEVEANLLNSYYIPIARLDHHRPGDSGFGRLPEDYFLASSVGQFITYLGLCIVRDGKSWAWSGLQPPLHAGINEDASVCFPSDMIPATITPQEVMLTAAADHCLGAAYRGECPHIDPDALMAWRIKQKAKITGKEEKELLQEIEAAQLECQLSSCIDLGGITIYDMRRDKPIMELPEAALRLGIGYISRVIDRGGATKICASGSKEQIEAFLKWAPDNGITKTYGDPMRGFAGGYES